MTNELFDHIGSAHSLPDAEILLGARAFDMDFDLYHDDLHANPDENLEHTHDPITGDVVADVLTLLDLNTVIRTKYGLEYQGLLSAVEDEFADLLNNNANLEIHFKSDGTDVLVTYKYLLPPLGHHEARCPDFETALRVAVGEASARIVGLL